jgi:hypothetical protein
MKSHLENFCTKVAYKTYDVDAADVDTKNLGIDITVILMLIETIAPIVLELIDNCQNQANLKNSVKSPNWLQKVRFRALVKKSLDSSGQSKFKYLSGKVADAFLAESAKLTDADLDKLLDESSVDNWLI